MARDNLSIMINEKLIQAINWETLILVCNNDTNKACKIWDKYNKFFTFPISSNFSLWAINLNISINKLFEIYTQVCEDFKLLPHHTKIVCCGDDNWPSQINFFEYSTRVLYCLGDVTLLKKNNVAIIGSKSPQKETLAKLDKVIKALIKKDVVVTSGLSFGLQGHAAVKGLAINSPIIAVIATSLGQYYPKSHKKIQDFIAGEGGVVVTRVAPNNKNLKLNILLRNRLMSALSSAVMIMEERDGEGSIQIADYSLKNDRKVFFFGVLKDEDSITWPKDLIEKGAKTLRYPGDLARFINGTSQTKKKKKKKSNNDDEGQLTLF